MAEQKQIQKNIVLPHGIKGQVVNGRITAPVVGNIKLAATPNTVPKIPTDWATLGATTGYCPKLAENLNIDVVGPSGEGKTTFISSIGNPNSPHIILDFDKGAEGIPGTKAVRIPIQSYEHYIQVTDKLKAEGKDNKRVFHRVSFDTTDEWVGMIVNRLQEEKGVDNITEFGSQGHGWALIRDRCFSKLRELQEAGYIWSCVGHMITKTETNPVTHKERTVIRDAVFPSMSAKIVRSSDYKITIYCINKTVDKMVKKSLPGGRVIEVPAGSEVVSKYYADICTTVEREGKGRGAPGMEKKFEIPLVNGWEVFKQKYNIAVEAAKKKYS